MKVITYDDILEGQTRQLSNRMILPGDDDFLDLTRLSR